MRRVMVVHTDSVFGSGVLRMLSGLEGVELISSNPTNQADLLEAVRFANPDVVVMTRGKVDLASVSRMLVVEKDEPRIRVILMNERSNLAYIYEKGQMVVSTSVDLLTLIQGDE